MAQFDEREKGEEARFALSAEMAFKAEARRNRLLGIWAAELMGLEGDAAKSYAAAVVAADFTAAGSEDVFAKVSADLKAKNLNVPDALIRQKITQLEAVAKQQVMTEG